MEMNWQLKAAGSVGGVVVTFLVSLVFTEPRFQWWGYVVLGLFVLAVVLGGWGGWQAITMKRQESVAKARDRAVLVKGLEAERQRLLARGSKLDYFRMVAAEYRDERRVEQIDAELATIQAKVADVDRKLVGD